MTHIEDTELRDNIESALMHFCELAVAGDPEKELNIATNLIEYYIEQESVKVDNLLRDIMIHAAPDGIQDGDFIGFYVIPTGPIHSAIAHFSSKDGLTPMGDVSVISQYQAHLTSYGLEREILQAESIKKVYELYSHESTPFYKALCEAIENKRKNLESLLNKEQQ